MLLLLLRFRIVQSCTRTSDCFECIWLRHADTATKPKWHLLLLLFWLGGRVAVLEDVELGISCVSGRFRRQVAQVSGQVERRGSRRNAFLKECQVGLVTGGLWRRHVFGILSFDFSKLLDIVSQLDPVIQETCNFLWVLFLFLCVFVLSQEKEKGELARLWV